MANLTLSVDDQLLQAARIRAVKEGTSVNEVCRRALENFARPHGGGRLQRFDALMAEVERLPGKPSRSPWKSRDQMYEELLSGKPRR